jgi:hypothetical protein
MIVHQNSTLRTKAILMSQSPMAANSVCYGVRCLPSPGTILVPSPSSRLRPGSLPALYWQSTCSLYSVSLYFLALLNNTVTGCVKTSPVKMSKVLRARAVSIWSSGYRQTISTFCCFKMPMDRTSEGSRLQCTSTPLSTLTRGIFTDVASMAKRVVSWLV